MKAMSLCLFHIFPLHRMNYSAIQFATCIHPVNITMSYIIHGVMVSEPAPESGRLGDGRDVFMPFPHCPPAQNEL